MDNSQLAEIRVEIDNLDTTIWSLLEKRFALSKEVAEIKSANQLPILDKKREEDVLAKIGALSCDKDISQAIAKLYILLFELSRTLQGQR